MILTGGIVGGVDFGGGALSPPAAYGLQTDVFVVKLSPVGAYIWARRAGGPWPSDVGNAVATDLNGNVVVAGCFQTSADFGGGAMTSVGADAFVVKFAP